MFVTWRGTAAANIITGSNIALSTQTSDVLVLSDFLGDAGQARQFEQDNWPSSDGRSLDGILRIKGKNLVQYPKIWKCSFLVKPAQLALFEQLQDAQGAINAQLRVQDNWEAIGTPVNVWMDTKPGYRRAIGSSWHNLTFDLYEVA
jgi:hypothetical protein